MTKAYLKSMGHYWRYLSIQRIHRFIYYLRKLPLIGKHLPYSLHQISQANALFTILALIIGFFKQILHKAFYFGLFFFFPLTAAETLPRAELGLYLYGIFIGLHLIVPISLQTVSMAKPEREYYEMLLIFKEDPKRFYMLKMFLPLLINVCFFMVFGLISFAFMGLPIGHLFLLLLSYVLVRLVSEALGCLIREKTDFLESKYQNWLFKFPVALLGLVVAYLPFIIMKPYPLTTLSLAILCLIAALLAVPSILYLKDYDFHILKRKSLDIQGFIANMNAIEDNSAVLNQFIVKKNAYTDHVPEKVTEGKSGLAYAHALFFYRFKKMFTRPVLIRFFVCLGAVLILLVVSLILQNRESFREGLAQFQIIKMMPIIFYLSAIVFSFGRNFTSLIFANMDRNLLPYSFYRRSDLVREGLRIRFLYLAKLTAPIILVLVIGLGGWAFLFIPEQGPDILIVLGTIVVETIFFNFYYLVTYYLFQPYNSNMQVKSLPMQLANFAIYFVTMFLYINADLPLMIYLAVAGLELVFILVSIPLVIRLAPKNFRLRQ